MYIIYKKKGKFAKYLCHARLNAKGNNNHSSWSTPEVLVLMYYYDKAQKSVNKTLNDSIYFLLHLNS